MQITENMYVIFNAIDLVQFTILLFYDAPDVLVELETMVVFDGGLPVFSAKNDLIIDLPETAHF